MKNRNENIIDILFNENNLDISKYEISFLEKSIQKRINETNSISSEAYCDFLKEDKIEAKIFFDSLNISYSEFCRNPLTFAVLERIILPSLISKNKGIRIWSAACAAGQEPYSIAMLLEELKYSDGQAINYRIFATDQNQAQIIEAEKGRYSSYALNNLNFKRVNQWFNRQGDIYSVKSELKTKIEFSVFDLLNEKLNSPPESIYGDFDLIFCANLLFYYKNEQRKVMLDKARASLSKDGFLVVGEAEREILSSYNFREAYPQSGIFRV